MRRLTVAGRQIADVPLDMAAQARPGSAEILIEKAYAEAWKLWADGEPLTSIDRLLSQVMLARDRSEERRGGQSVSVCVDSGGRRIIKKTLSTSVTLNSHST